MSLVMSIVCYPRRNDSPAAIIVSSYTPRDETLHKINSCVPDYTNVTIVEIGFSRNFNIDISIDSLHKN